MKRQTIYLFDENANKSFITKRAAQVFSAIKKFLFVCFFSRFSPCIGVITTTELTPTSKCVTEQTDHFTGREEHFEHIFRLLTNVILIVITMVAKAI